MGWGGSLAHLSRSACAVSMTSVWSEILYDMTTAFVGTSFIAGVINPLPSWPAGWRGLQLFRKPWWFAHFDRRDLQIPPDCRVSYIPRSIHYVSEGLILNHLNPPNVCFYRVAPYNIFGTIIVRSYYSGWGCYVARLVVSAGKPSSSPYWQRVLYGPATSSSCPKKAPSISFVVPMVLPFLWSESVAVEWRVLWWIRPLQTCQGLWRSSTCFASPPARPGRVAPATGQDECVVGETSIASWWGRSAT